MKAILVMDMPENCRHCGFTSYDGDFGMILCRVTGCYIDETDKYRSPNCLFKEAPEPLEVLEDDDEYSKGFNAALKTLGLA